MEFQTLLESRRSVRSYDASKTVTREQIKEIVEAGILAPSWKNSQTARYYCVIDEAAKEKKYNSQVDIGRDSHNYDYDAVLNLT